MNILILNGPRDAACTNFSYRGTYRLHPTHCDELPDTHEINRLFLWFLEEGGELGVVQDLTKALRLAELWNARLPTNDQFDVVDVSTDEGYLSEGIFIGFDLSAGYNNSLLWPGLKEISASVQVQEPIRELWALVCRYFAPHLNRDGLFSDRDTAQLCLRSMIALQDLSPGFFEGGALRNFRPTSLHLLGGRQRN